MTRKDYEMLAACFGLAYRDANGNTTKEAALYDVQLRIALELELDNPRFDRKRFNAAIEKIATSEN